MKSLFFNTFTLVVVLIFFSCQRELKEDPTSKEINVSVVSDLEEFTGTVNAGFVNTSYDLALTLTSKYKTGQYPVTTTYECSKSITVSQGVSKFYDKSDTISFVLNKVKTLKVTAKESGNYRLHLNFKDQAGQVIGTKELNFNINDSDLKIFMIRDGKRVENLNTTFNFNETEGEFLVRVTAEKETLNKGALKLKTNIKGTSVKVANWEDGDSKNSKDDDNPHSVDFSVKYKNIKLGTTGFTFTASTKNITLVAKDSITVVESKPGEISLSAEKKETIDGSEYYTSKQLWVGQNDSVEYIIVPHPSDVLKDFKVRFRTKKDVTKLHFHNTPKTEKQSASTEYIFDKWHDFKNQLHGKLYYVFNSAVNYSDTIYMDSKNGEAGKINTIKFFVSCKQSDDFTFGVTFKPTLVGGYDEIKYSELITGINNPVILTVNDQNPYNGYDYELSWQNMTTQQQNIAQTFTVAGTTIPQFDVYGKWLANGFGLINNITTKSFQVVIKQIPTEATATGYIGTFNWVYTIKRVVDNKTKTVTRQIKVLDDRLSFLLDMAVNNSRESTYQNETLTAYQLKYQSPSTSADDYQLTVTSNNEDVADVYLVNKDMTFRKATFGTAEIPPASHNPSGTMFAPADIGKIQIKGKKPGTAVLSFMLKHKTSGATRTMTKTVSTIEDPVQYVIEPATTIDALQKERDAIQFGGPFHTYQNPRFKIRLLKSSSFANNTSGTASVIFSTTSSLTNVAKLTIRGGGAYGTPGYHGGETANYGTAIELAYDTDYFVTVTCPTTHPWNIPVGSDQWLNIKMTKATNQQTQIVADYNDKVKYTLREYKKPLYTVTAVPYNESGCNNQNIETSSSPVYVYEAKVVISAVNYSSQVTKTSCSGTFNLNNPALSDVTWNDGHELYSPLYVSGTSGNYSKDKIVGDIIEAMPGQTPSDPYWNYMGAGVTLTHYGGVKTTVRDNWNCGSEVYVTIPSKIVYGTY